jgi:hypothetical protein
MSRKPRRPPFERRPPDAPAPDAKSEKSRPLKSNWDPREPPPGSAPVRRHRIAVLNKTELIVHGTLLGVTQHIISFLDVLEALLGGLVTRIQVGVVFARELAIGLANFLRIGFARYAQRFVLVVLGSRHRF